MEWTVPVDHPITIEGMPPVYIGSYTKQMSREDERLYRFAGWAAAITAFLMAIAVIALVIGI